MNVVPRPAATMVLVREAHSGPEALLVQRPPDAVFGPGAWVFPGGAVDDGDAEIARLSPELALQLATRMDLSPDVAVAYLGAALRETFEETAIPVAGFPPELSPASGRKVVISHPHLDNVPGAGLGEIVYLSRWITPPGLPRRYDTRFFLAQVGDRCEPVINRDELIAWRWLRPADAVAGNASGELVMMPPTVRTLESLVPYHSLEKMLRALREMPPESYLSLPRREPDV